MQCLNALMYNCRLVKSVNGDGQKTANVNCNTEAGTAAHILHQMKDNYVSWKSIPEIPRGQQA